MVDRDAYEARNSHKEPEKVSKKREMAPPGSIAAVSRDVGYDVRDRWMMGLRQGEERQYSKEAIQNFANGKISLEELRSGKERPGK